MTLYSAYVLPDDVRIELLKQFPPKYERVFAHHVTYEFGQRAQQPPESDVVVVGYLDTTTGVEALVVEVGGTTQRKDMSRYHITWSLGQGYKPYDSNRMLHEFGWENVQRKPIHTIPTIISK